MCDSRGHPQPPAVRDAQRLSIDRPRAAHAQLEMRMANAYARAAEVPLRGNFADRVVSISMACSRKERGVLLGESLAKGAVRSVHRSHRPLFYFFKENAIPYWTRFNSVLHPESDRSDT